MADLAGGSALVLARLAYPIARMLQARFRRDSARAMQRAPARPGASL